MKYKRIIYGGVKCATAAFGMMFLLAGCTHNNGDIGPLFGKWKLVKMEFQNVDPSFNDGAVYWNFQNSTVCMQLVTDNHEEQRTFGNWREEDNTLYLDFPDENFAPFATLQLPREAELQIMSMKGSDMKLQYNPTPSQAIIYTLEKW